MTNAEAGKIVRAILCRGMTFEETEQILKAMVPIEVETGAAIFEEGDKAKGLVVLLEGTAEVLKSQPEGRPMRIAVLEGPTVIGEMSLVSDRPHSATVRGVTACQGRLLTRSQLERLIQAESLAAYKVVMILADVIAKRLARMDERVLELTRRIATQPVV